MPSKSQMAVLKERVNSLHSARFKPPLHRWIEEQDTEKLTTLRQRLEAGQDIITAMEGLLE